MGNLSPVLQRVLDAIRSRDNKARPEDLVDDLGTSVETIARHCRQLQQLGYLVRHNGPSGTVYKVAQSGWLLRHAPKSQWRGVEPRGQAPAALWCADDVGARQAQALAVLAALGGRDVRAARFAKLYQPRAKFAAVKADLERFQEEGLLVLDWSDGISVTLTRHGVRLAEVLGMRVRE